ncbi:hypothetical protein NPIL_255401 [Nephila pilipes]|uniref:Uncharacterized protein n=1 Tax=Nephila pilipes TaxID=299642 RepID=A0A8X6NCM5_NEPPI|nr:hypothetical protein NPIL_255401 [Nephila pilipes]
MDFLQKAGIVMNLKHCNWFYSDSPHRTYDFVKEVANPEDPDVPIGVYHTSTSRPHQDPSTKPLTPLRKRGKPRKSLLGSSPTWRQGKKKRL